MFAEAVAQYEFTVVEACELCAERAADECVGEHGGVSVRIEVEDEETVFRGKDGVALFEQVEEAFVEFPAFAVGAVAVGRRVEDQALVAVAAPGFPAGGILGGFAGPPDGG